jgi:hypothetical protein
LINVGTHTFVPEDDVVTVGAFTLGENDDTIWVEITQDQVTGPWPWSYGILGFRSAFGYELGTVKAFSKPEGVIQRLGVGRPPLERSGVITFQPRSFNLAWIRQGNPWTLTFTAESGVTAGTGVGVVSNSFVNAANGNGLPLTRITFPQP